MNLLFSIPAVVFDEYDLIQKLNITVTVTVKQTGKPMQCVETRFLNT
jgi:hypothetical protein